MNFKELKLLLESDDSPVYFFVERGEYYKIMYYDVPICRSGSTIIINPLYYNEVSHDEHTKIRIHSNNWRTAEIGDYCNTLLGINKDVGTHELLCWVKRGVERFYAEEEIREYLEKKSLNFDFDGCAERLVIPLGSFATKAAHVAMMAMVKMMNEVKEYRYLYGVFNYYFTVRMGLTKDSFYPIPSGLPQGIPGGVSQEYIKNTPFSVSICETLRKLRILPSLVDMRGFLQ